MKARFLSSIKNQITLIIICSIIVTLIMGLTFYNTSVRIMSTEHANVISRLMLQASDSVSKQIEEMKYIASSLSNNNTVQSYLTDNDPLSKHEYGLTLSDFAGDLLLYSTSISHILLVTPECNIFSATQHNVVTVDYLDAQYHIFDQEYLDSGLIAPITNAADNVPHFIYYCPIFKTFGQSRQIKIGTCLVFTPLNVINQILTTATASDEEALVIYNDLDAPFASGAANPVTEYLLSLSGRPSDGYLDSGRFRCQVRNAAIPDTPWFLVSADAGYGYMKSMFPLMLLGLFICLVFIMIAIAWNSHIRHSLTKPLAELAEYVTNQPKTGLSLRLPANPSNEIGILYGQINELLQNVARSTDEIISNQRDIYELKLAKNKSELSALQSQINPHFLYNTLNCIKGYGYTLGSREIVTITNSLAAIMRYCIKGPEFVTVDTELSIVKDYLDIISIRFSNRFQFMIDVNEKYRRLLIPRFILQPLIENAVYHGLEPKPGAGSISLYCTGTDENRSFSFVIKDDGIGMSAEALDELRTRLSLQPTPSFEQSNSLGLALPNIQSRIRRIYGAPYGLRIDSEENEGTLIELLLPMRES